MRLYYVLLPMIIIWTQFNEPGRINYKYFIQTPSKIPFRFILLLNFQSTRVRFECGKH